MRILMTADAVGGVWTHALALVAGLARHEVEVMLAVLGPGPDDAQRAEAQALSNLRVAEGPFPLEWMEGAEADQIAAGRWLLALADMWQPQIVHLNGYAHAGLPWGTPVVVGAHSCVCTWWQAVHGVPAPADWNRYRAMVGEALRAADVVVAPSHAFLRSLVGAYGPFPSGTVIHNGLDPSHFHATSKNRTVIGAGRLWDEAKNLASLAAIAGDLPGEVLVAGDPGDAVDWPAGARLLGRLDRSGMRQAYANAAICALPCRYEPFGLVPLEAALSGCALVLGDIPTFRELWDGAAVFVAPDDPTALRDRLALLLEEPQSVQALGRFARRRGLRYTAERMADRYAGLYSDLCLVGSLAADADLSLQASVGKTVTQVAQP